MKIAILLPGQPRFTGDFDRFLTNFIGYERADWFIYVTNNNIDERYKRRKVTINESWKIFDLDWAYEKIDKNLPVNNSIKRIEISDAHKQEWPEVKNIKDIKKDWVDIIFMMFYNIQKANQLRLDYEKENNIKYDLIVRTRSDIGIENIIDIKKIDFKSNSIYTANNSQFGFDKMKINDWFALGTSNSMNVYCNTIDHIKNYNDNGTVFHPETLLAFHLRNNNINNILIKANITLRKYKLNIKKWT